MHPIIVGARSPMRYSERQEAPDVKSLLGAGCGDRVPHLLSRWARSEEHLVCDITAWCMRPQYADGPLEGGLCAKDRQACARRCHPGADIFLGLSAPNVLKPEMVKAMRSALVMALANPTPEIMPDEARKARPDA